MKKNNLFKRIGAAVLTVALSTGLLATTALAADPTVGSITVHKYATMGDSTLPGDGKLIKDQAVLDGLGTPLEGAKFNLYKINDAIVTADLNVEGITKENVTSDYTLVSEEVTAADGTIVWDGLEKGYYLLIETAAPSDEYKLTPNSIIKLPYGYNPKGEPAETTEANWDIHVYPKNVNNEKVTKVVKDGKPAYVVDDVVTWEIGAKLPEKLVNGTNYAKAEITDTLDSRLTYDATNAPAKVELTGGTGTILLTEGTDYKEDASVIKWTLTEEGMKKAAEAGSTAIRITLETKINETAQGGSTASISNNVSVTTEDADGNTDGPNEPGVKPEIKLGGVKIYKYVNEFNDKGQALAPEDSKPLAGAKFNLIIPGTPDKFVVDKAGNPIVVTTDSEGYAHFVDFTNVSPVINWKAENTFKLKEVAAPDGYILRDAEVEVVVEAETYLGEVAFANQAQGDNPIPGDPSPSFVLPMTGGMGTVLFTAIGLLLMIGAAVVLVKTRKANA